MLNPEFRVLNSWSDAFSIRNVPFSIGDVHPPVMISTYWQYDTLSKSVGTNSKLRWTFRALGDLFVIYNHNVRQLADRWQLDSNQLLVKLQYAFRY